MEDRKKLENKKLYYNNYNKKTLANLYKEEKINENDFKTIDNPCVFNYSKTRGNIENFNNLKRKKHFVKIFYNLVHHNSR